MEHSESASLYLGAATVKYVLNIRGMCTHGQHEDGLSQL